MSRFEYLQTVLFFVHEYSFFVKPDHTDAIFFLGVTKLLVIAKYPALSCSV